MTLIEHIDTTSETLAIRAWACLETIAIAQAADEWDEQQKLLIELARIRGRQAQLKIIRQMVIEGKIKELM